MNEDIIRLIQSSTDPQGFASSYIQEYGSEALTNATPSQIGQAIQFYEQEGYIQSANDLQAYYEVQAQRRLVGTEYRDAFTDPTRDEDEGPRLIDQRAVVSQQDLNTGGAGETPGERRLRQQEVEWLKSTGRDQEAFLLQWQGKTGYSDGELGDIWSHLQNDPRPIDPSGTPVMSKGRYQGQVRVAGRFGRSLFKNSGELVSQLEKSMRVILKENFNSLFPSSDGRNRREVMLQAIDEGTIEAKEDGDLVNFVFTIKDLPTKPWSTPDGRYTEQDPPSTWRLGSWLFFGHRPSVTKDPVRGSRFWNTGKGRWSTKFVIRGFEGRNIFNLKQNQLEDVTDLLGKSLVATMYRLFQE